MILLIHHSKQKKRQTNYIYGSFQIDYFLLFLVVVFLSIKLSECQTIQANNDAKRLYDDLINGYNRLVRPVGNNSDKLTVYMGLKLTQILDVDEKNQIMTTNVWVRQEWVDYKLTWDPAKYGGVDVLYVPSLSIWVPDIVLYNNADGNYEVTLMTKATVHYDGKVLWEPPAIYKSSCTIDVEFFPFDEQLCKMKFGSWTYDGFQVDLIHVNQKIDKSDYIPIGIDLRDYYRSVEWDIMSVPAKRTVKSYPCCPEPYPDITFNITIRRKTLFYTVNLIIPCVGISFLTVLTFYLPSDSGEKIALCVSILLSLTVFFLLLAELIPPTSLVVPLIGKYLLFTMILVTLSILVTVIVLNIHFRSPSTHTMPPWVRKIFLKILPRLLLMREPQEPLRTYEIPWPPVNDLNSFINSHFDNNNKTTFVQMPPFSPQSRPHSLYNDIRLKRRVRLIKTASCSSAHLEHITTTTSTSKTPPPLTPPKTTQKFITTTPEVRKAIDGISYVCEHLRKEDQEKMIKEQWKYVALVVDRLFLWIFTTACLVGTCSIILSAPSFYDSLPPIDKQISKRFTT